MNFRWRSAPDGKFQGFLCRSQWVSLGLAALFGLGSPLFLPSARRDVLARPAIALEERRVAVEALFQDGKQLFEGGQLLAALDKWQQALAIYRAMGDRAPSLRSGEGQTLVGCGVIYTRLGQYREAMARYEEALAIFQELGDRDRQASTLGGLGEVARRLGASQKALAYFQQALKLEREAGDRAGEAITLNGLGLTYQDLGNAQQAIACSKLAIALNHALGDGAGEGRSWINLGAVRANLGRHPEALSNYQQALAIYREMGNLTEVGTTLGRMGRVYRDLGQYQDALERYEEALTLAQNIGDRRLLARSTIGLGLVYRDLGQYQEALSYYQQASTLYPEMGNLIEEGIALNGIGMIRYDLEQYRKALSYYERAIAIYREAGDRAEEGITLNNIGNVYRNLGQYQDAIAHYQLALSIHQDLSDRAGEGTVLHNLGKTYSYLGETQTASEYYWQALAIDRSVGDRAGERTTLNNLGQLLERQNQPQLAILFYKQAVNVTETIRQDLRQLPPRLQQSYTETVAATYRHLADLLLQQDRVLEAQRILDLLKVQELQDYLQDVRGNANTTQGLPNTPPERQIWASYDDLANQAVQIGRELAEIRQVLPKDRTVRQQQRLDQLIAAQEELVRNFNAFIESPEILALVEQLRPTIRKPDLVDDLEELLSLQDNLRDLNQNAVLFYPLILEDRLELILVTPDSPPIRRTVEVTRKELNDAIREFRRRLQNPIRDAQPAAQQLYTWLVKPLEADLTAAEAKTLLYAPDGPLRYIPLAALHDGDRWLVQRFRINNITAASLTDLNSQPQRQVNILAGAFANVSYPVVVGEEEFVFRALPYAGKEVEILAATIPSTTPLIDAAFSRDAIVSQMDDYTIVHFATHGALVAGSPQDSFIIFGDGEIATVAEIKNWSLRNVDLVVLSACQTGLGGELGNGDEILGLGYQFQRAGARATIATLWSVNDGGTQVLMNGFYRALQQPGITKVEALRQAQLAAIAGEGESEGNRRGLITVREIEALPPLAASRLSHPYYWAPFIAIGNGL